MRPFGLVELQGSGQRLEDAGGGAGDLAALEPGVVLHAQPGEGGDLAAPQSGDPAGAGGREADLVGGDAGAAGGQELAHLLAVVHDLEPRPGRAVGRVREGCPVSAPIDRDSHRGGAPGSLDDVAPSCHHHCRTENEPRSRTRCVRLSCTDPGTCGSRTARTRRSSSRPTPSSACRRPASAAATCGPTAAPSRSTTR